MFSRGFLFVFVARCGWILCLVRIRPLTHTRLIVGLKYSQVTEPTSLNEMLGKGDTFDEEYLNKPAKMMFNNFNAVYGRVVSFCFVLLDCRREPLMNVCTYCYTDITHLKYFCL